MCECQVVEMNNLVYNVCKIVTLAPLQWVKSFYNGNYVQYVFFFFL